MKREDKKIRDQQGISLAIVLCVGALLVTLSALLVRQSSGAAGNLSREVAREQAYQLAVSFSDRLKDSLCGARAGEDGLAAFLNQHFLTAEYDAQPLTLTSGTETDAAYGEITLTLEKQALPMTRTVPTGQASELEVILTGWDNTQVADYLVKVTVTATLPTTAFSYTESYHRWVDCSAVYEYQGQRYSYTGGRTFRSEDPALPALILPKASQIGQMTCRFVPDPAGKIRYTSVAEEWKNEG